MGRMSFRANVDSLAIGALWVVALGALVWAVVVSLNSALDTVAKIAVAVIGAAALILSGILTQSLTAFRELALEQRRMRQERYWELLNQLAEYVRRRDSARDGIDTAQLYSWVVGSEAVIRASQDFVATVSDRNLRALLLAMRADMGFPKVEDDLTPSALFPTPPPAHGLRIEGPNPR